MSIADIPQGAIQAAYLAPEGLEITLQEEIERAGRSVLEWHGPLALSAEPPFESKWALDVWTQPSDIPVASIKSAAAALRGMQRNWSHLPVDFHRRSALIAENLPPVQATYQSYHLMILVFGALVLVSCALWWMNHTGRLEASNFSTTGGSVPGGMVGYSQPASEAHSVNAPLRSTCPPK